MIGFDPQLFDAGCAKIEDRRFVLETPRRNRKEGFKVTGRVRSDGRNGEFVSCRSLCCAEPDIISVTDQPIYRTKFAWSTFTALANCPVGLTATAILTKQINSVIA